MHKFDVDNVGNSGFVDTAGYSNGQLLFDISYRDEAGEVILIKQDELNRNDNDILTYNTVEFFELFEPPVKKGNWTDWWWLILAGAAAALLIVWMIWGFTKRKRRNRRIPRISKK